MGLVLSTSMHAVPAGGQHHRESEAEDVYHQGAAGSLG